MAKSIKVSKEVLNTYVELKEVKARREQLRDLRAVIPAEIFTSIDNKLTAYIKGVQAIELEF